MFLYHYYDKKVGPFRNLSDLPINEAKDILDNIRLYKPNSQCAKRQLSYMEDRMYYENILREAFIQKGGKIERKVPHYMVIEHSPWLSTWYEETDYKEILGIIEQYGLPQDWNNDYHIYQTMRGKE